MLVNKDKNQQGCNKIWTRLGFPAVVLLAVLKAAGRGTGRGTLRKLLLMGAVRLGTPGFWWHWLLGPALWTPCLFLGSNDFFFCLMVLSSHILFMQWLSAFFQSLPSKSRPCSRMLGTCLPVLDGSSCLVQARKRPWLRLLGQWLTPSSRCSQFS